MAGLPRLSALQGGQIYDIPVFIKKVGKINLTTRGRMALSPYWFWETKKVEKIDGGSILRMRKSYIRRFFPPGSPFEQTDKISVREAHPASYDDVAQLTRQIVERLHIPESDILLIDYALHKTLLGSPFVVIWWLPDDVLRRGIEETRRQSGVYSRTVASGTIADDMIGHTRFSQVWGPELVNWSPRSPVSYIRPARRSVPPAPAPGPAPNIRNLRTATESYNAMNNIGSLNIPKGSANTITLDDIQEGDEMVNFHGEHEYGRFYKKSSFNRIPVTYPSQFKKNPTTRANITRKNAKKYKAHLVGGKKNRTGKRIIHNDYK